MGAGWPVVEERGPIVSRPWIAVLAVVAAALTGCSSASASQRVAATADATTGSGSAAFGITQSFEGGANDGQSFSGEGVIDFDEQRGSATFDLGAAGQGLGGGSGEVTSVFDGTTVYVRLGIPQLPTEWLRIDLTELDGLAGLEDLQQFSSDPSQALGLLRGASDDVEEVGEEQVRGDTTTHYRLTVDLERAQEQAPDDAKAYIRQQIETLGVTELGVEVWLDADDVLRRQSYTVVLSQAELPGASELPEGALPTAIATTLEFYDFGTEVAVEAPAEGEYTDVSDLLGASGAGGPSPAPS